jgi:uncharacterized phage infection (PIP) family protein YhgE
MAVLLVAIPVMQELARTARSAEKLLDMLSRELPPTLRSLRNTGEDLSQLSGQMHEGVRNASQVVSQVDQGLETVRNQAETVKRGSLSLLSGLRAAWQQWQANDLDLVALDENWDPAEDGASTLNGQYGPEGNRSSGEEQAQEGNQEFEANPDQAEAVRPQTEPSQPKPPSPINPIDSEIERRDPMKRPSATTAQE